MKRMMQKTDVLSLLLNNNQSQPQLSESHFLECFLDIKGFKI